MSFLKIKDPVKRDQIVKEYLATKKRIRDSQLAERTGEIELQTGLSKFFKPITETQKEAATKITEGLTPIRKGIQQLPGVISEELTPIREGIIKLPVQLSKEMMPSQLPSTSELPSYHEVEIEKK